jgi:hypothetical protein
MTPPSLDLACATAGRNAAKEIGADGVSFFSDLANILHRNGLYMVFAYLLKPSAKSDAVNPKYHPLLKIFHTLLKENLSESALACIPATATSMVSDISTVFGDHLPELIQAKAILERCLDYASAHAKSYRATAAPPKGKE